MERKRVIIPIIVDLDPVPGEFHTQESAEHHIQRILNDAIGHYHPKVATSPKDMLQATWGAPPEGAQQMLSDLLGGDAQEMLGNLAKLAAGIPDEVMNSVMENMREAFTPLDEDAPEIPDYPPTEDNEES